jgi:hypothetical protein
LSSRSEASRFFVGDFVGAGGDVHDQKAALVLGFDLAAYTPRVDIAPAPGDLLGGVLLVTIALGAWLFPKSGKNGRMAYGRER